MLLLKAILNGDSMVCGQVRSERIGLDKKIYEKKAESQRRKTGKPYKMSEKKAVVIVNSSRNSSFFKCTSVYSRSRI
jgi:hypothetical protein